MGGNMDSAIQIIAVVAKVISQNKVIINKGSDDGFKMGQKLCVYAKGEDVIDPVTGNSLGCIEIIKGYGYIVQIQERMSVVEANNMTEKEKVYAALSIYRDGPRRSAAFDDVHVGDLVKQA
jgi:hypothetical protein